MGYFNDGFMALLDTATPKMINTTTESFCVFLYGVAMVQQIHNYSISTGSLLLDTTPTVGNAIFGAPNLKELFKIDCVDYLKSNCGNATLMNFSSQVNCGYHHHVKSYEYALITIFFWVCIGLYLLAVKSFHLL